MRRRQVDASIDECLCLKQLRDWKDLMNRLGDLQSLLLGDIAIREYGELTGFEPGLDELIDLSGGDRLKSTELLLDRPVSLLPKLIRVITRMRQRSLLKKEEENRENQQAQSTSISAMGQWAVHVCLHARLALLYCLSERSFASLSRVNCSSRPMARTALICGMMVRMNRGSLCE